MARLSKAHAFAIYEDAGILTPDADGIPEKTRATSVTKEDPQAEKSDNTAENANSKQSLSHKLIDHVTTTASDADDERRESASTTTTVSSTADSMYRISIDNVIPMHQPYTPPFIRPSFRRPQSVQRMQMTSPSPSRTTSPRHSLLSKSRSRGATPRSVRSVTAKGSPRSRKRWMVQENSEDEDRKQDPLVLLHVVLLPVHARWNEQMMEQILPERTLEQFRSLRSKISDTVLERGVLIPHPREDYQLLEERLLEALGLQQPRITPCGHFIPRPLSENGSSGGEDVEDSDSGVGSGLDEMPKRICDTCLEPVQSGAGSWDVKAFASNGLLRALAWAAAWTEMERVDVEILPFIDDDTRRELDERKRHEDEEKGLPDSGARSVIAQTANNSEGFGMNSCREAQPERPYPEDTTSDTYTPPNQRDEGLKNAVETPTAIQRSFVEGQEHMLPEVYRHSQIPLSILLKNYIYLLAQDRKNVVIFFFVALLAFLLATRSSTPGRPPMLDIIDDSYSTMQHTAATSLLATANPLQVPSGEEFSEQAEKLEDAMEFMVEVEVGDDQQPVEPHSDRVAFFE